MHKELVIKRVSRRPAVGCSESILEKGLFFEKILVNSVLNELLALRVSTICVCMNMHYGHSHLFISANSWIAVFFYTESKPHYTSPSFLAAARLPHRTLDSIYINGTLRMQVFGSPLKIQNKTHHIVFIA